MEKNLYTLLSMILTLPVVAGEVSIVDARATASSTDVYRFDVTLRHADTGWDHYADGWEVISPSGEVLGRRTLYHPHVNEQPFTRALSGVAVPEGIDHVQIRAHDKLHGHSTKMHRIDLE